MKKRNIIIAVIAVVLLFCVTACILVPNFTRVKSNTDVLFKYDKTHNSIDVSENDQYELEQVLVISRHNIALAGFAVYVIIRKRKKEELSDAEDTE